MKLDGELAFYHSNIGKPESQSFELDVDDRYSAGCRSEEDEEAKGNVKRVSVDLEANKVNLDQLPNKMEAEEDALTSPKPDSHASIVGLKNENEEKVKDSIKPVSDSPQDIELLTESPSDPCPNCPQDIESVESPDLPGTVDSFKNPADIYMDKSVTECEPELVVVYKESSDHVIKDICVDEGIPAEEKILLENTNEEVAYKFSSSELEDHKSEKLTKDNVAVDAPFPVFIDLPAITEESDKVSTNHYKFEDLMLNDFDDETRKFAHDVDKEMLLAGYKVLLQDLDDEEQTMPLIEEGNKAEQNHSQVSSEPELPSKHKECEDRVEEAVSTSPSAESNGNVSKVRMPENGGITSQFDDPPVPASSAKEDESDQVGEPKNVDDARNSSDSLDVKPDDHQAATSHVRHSLGETSFSAVGRVSSRITYLDPVPYSGSISLRSDSSTTSTRSFAFPVIQSEWNSSPVRMAKADRRHYRKHRGWRQGLLCCRF